MMFKINMKTILLMLYLLCMETKITLTHHHQHRRDHRDHVNSLFTPSQSTSGHRSSSTTTSSSMNIYNFRPPSDFLKHKESHFDQEKPPHVENDASHDLLPITNREEDNDPAEEEEEVENESSQEQEIPPMQPPPRPTLAYQNPPHHHQRSKKDKNPMYFDPPGNENDGDDRETKHSEESDAYDFFDELDDEDFDMMEGFYQELENYLPKPVTTARTRKPPTKRQRRPPPQQQHHRHYQAPKNNFTFKRPFMAKPEFPLPHLPPHGPPKAAWNYVNVHSIRSAHDSNGISEIGGQNVTTMWSIAPHGGFIMTEERRGPHNHDNNGDDQTMVSMATTTVVSMDKNVSMIMKKDDDASEPKNEKNVTSSLPQNSK